MKKLTSLLLALLLSVSVLTNLPQMPLVPGDAPSVPGVEDHQNSDSEGAEEPGVSPQSQPGGEEWPGEVGAEK